MTDYTLYLVLNRETLPDERLLPVARSAVAGGVSLVQWRDKTGRPIGALLQELHAFLRSLDIPLIINDDASLAHRIGAEGVHLGQEDGDPVAARALLGPRAILGRSVSNEAQLRQVASEPIDYVGIGPAYATATKANHAEPLGVAGVARLRRQIAHLPAVAIGGIDAQRAGAVMAAGVNGLAVVSAICAAADPERAARELVSIVKEAG